MDPRIRFSPVVEADFLARLDSTSHTTVHENLSPLDQTRFDLTAASPIMMIFLGSNISIVQIHQVHEK